MKKFLYLLNCVKQLVNLHTSLKCAIVCVAMATVSLSSLNAQISEGGTPPSFQFMQARNLTPLPEVNIPVNFDVQALRAEDVEREAAGMPPRMGKIIPVNFTTENSGEWTTLPDGTVIWRLNITARDALAVMLTYDKFEIPAGGRLFIYDGDRTRILGAYTSNNNPKREEYATEFVPGNRLILEYVLPAQGNSLDETPIIITGFVYGYKNHTFGPSGDCMVFVNCPEGNGWQDQKKGVVRIVTPTGGGYVSLCSGSMVNNTAGDFDPLLLSAYHCYSSLNAAQINQSIHYFHYEVPGCQRLSVSDPVPTITGATKLVEVPVSNGSDGILLRLNSPIPQSYDVFYNGWDRQNIAAQSGVGIHHPGGDVKMISTFTSAVMSGTTNLSGQPMAPNSIWRVTWANTTTNHGVTAGGSSGSPLFNQNKRIVGTLAGGSSECENPTATDAYGKLWYHWDQMSNSSQRMHQYLDPINSGATSIDGSYDTRKMVSVGTQNGTIIAGTAGTATYTVSTGNINNGQTGGTVQWYSNAEGTNQTTTPTWITNASVSTVSNSAATVTIQAGTNAVAGLYWFRVIIDGEQSAVTTLRVLSPGNLINLSDATITNGATGSNWSFSNNIYTINSDANLTVTGSNQLPASSQRRIVVATNAQNVKITLVDVNIEGLGSQQSPLLINNGADATVTLVGTNRLTGGDSRSGIQVSVNAKLTIDGEGTLTANGGNASAGIGGSNVTGSNNAGEIIINSGNITANGGSATASGIGGGNQGSGGNITINGGTVAANGGTRGAGIGGGVAGNGGTITINGGLVTATSGGQGAAIGSGCFYGTGLIGNGGTINITGGVITATGGSFSAGIGGGSDANGGTVTITGGVATATGGAGAQGIGRGDDGGSSGTLTLNGNAVVFANTVGDMETSRKTSGILFVENTGTFYGTSVTLTDNVTIPASRTLTIPQGATFTIPSGITLTNNGTITDQGTININGTFSGNRIQFVNVGNLTATVSNSSSGIDLTSIDGLFTINKNAGERTYTLVSGSTTGVGSISGSNLTVTAPGNFNISLTTAETNHYIAGAPVSSILTVEAASATPVISITTHPTPSTTIIVGNSGNLSVVASATQGATLTYQWYSNTTASNTGGTIIDGATSANFTIPAGTFTNTYYYYCVVSAEGAASVTSGVATVFVAAKPKVWLTSTHYDLNPGAYFDITLAYEILPGIGNQGIATHITYDRTMFEHVPLSEFFLDRVRFNNISEGMLGIDAINANGGGGTYTILNALPLWSPSQIWNEVHVIDVASMFFKVKDDAPNGTGSFDFNLVTGGTYYVNGNNVALPASDIEWIGTPPITVSTPIPAYGLKLAVSNDGNGGTLQVTDHENAVAADNFSPPTVGGTDNPAEFDHSTINVIRQGGMLAFKAEPVPDFEVQQWKINGAPFNEYDTQVSLPNGKATLTRTGDVENLLIEDISGLIDVEVAFVEKIPPAPVITITTQPTAITSFIVNQISGSLSVSATVSSGGAAPLYQWYSTLENNYQNSTLIVGAESSEFIIPNDLPVGTHFYHCRVTSPDVVGTRYSNIATVHVWASTPEYIVTREEIGGAERLIARLLGTDIIIGNAGPTGVAGILTSIRNHASELDCMIQFGDGIDQLNIGNANFNNPVDGVSWGKVTIKGKIYSPDSYSIMISNDVNIDIEAEIKGLANNNIRHNGTGTVTISRKVEGTGGSTLHNEGGGTITIVAGAEIIADNGNAINNIGNGTINITGGKISAGTGSAILTGTTGKITITGGELVSNGVAGGNTINVLEGSGELTISGATTVTNTGAGRAIFNRSQFTTINGGTISASGANAGNSTIVNNAGYEITISGATIKATAGGNAIQNNGIVKVTNGTIEATDGIGINNNDAGAKVEIIGGSVTSTNGNALFNTQTGVITASNATISSAGSAATIEMTGAGTVDITSSSSSSSSVTNSGGGRAISNRGNAAITIIGGTVSADAETIFTGASSTIEIGGGANVMAANGIAIHNQVSGKVTINDATVTATSDAISNNNTGVIEINDGATVIATSGSAIVNNQANGRININGGTITGAVDNILAGWTTLSGSPTINGAIRTQHERLSVADNFAPEDGKEYSIDLSTTPANNRIVVIGGAVYFKNFNLANQPTFHKAVNGENIVYTNNLRTVSFDPDKLHIIDNPFSDGIPLINNGVLSTKFAELIETSDDCHTGKWYSDKEGTQEFTFGSTITGNITLYLKDNPIVFLPQTAQTPFQLKMGQIDEAYSEEILATRGGMDCKVTLEIIDGALPAGLTLSPDGEITGTPTDDGEFTFTVKATSTDDVENSEERVFEIIITDEDIYDVVVAQSNNGTVTATPAAATAGTEITLIIAPDAGYELDDVTVTRVDNDVTVSLSNTYTFEMPDSDVTVEATFEAITYAINFGTLTGGAVTSAPANEATAAATVTLTVTPETGKQLVANSLTVTYNDGTDDVNVTLTAGTAAGTWTFTMPAFAVNVYAEFEDIPVLYAINIGTLTGGAVTSAPATEATAATTVTLTVLPETGKQLVANSLTVTYNNGTDDVNVTLTAGTVAGTWTFTMPAFAVTVVAEFEDIPVLYAINIDPFIGGAVASSPANEAIAATTVTLTVTPETGKQLVANSLTVRYNNGTDAVNVTLTAGTAAGTWTFTMPAFAVTVDAEFEDIPVLYAINIGTLTGGAVTSAPANEATAAATVTLTVMPETGKQLVAGSLTVTYNNGTDDVNVTLTAGTVAGTWTFTMPAFAVTVYAEFEDIPVLYAINIGTLTGGAVTSAPATEATAAATVTLTVTPETGKQLVANSLTVRYNNGTDDVNVTLTAGTVAGTWTFTMPAFAVNVYAEFEDIPVLYAINIGTFVGGAVTSAPANEAPAAATVTLTVLPETGKQLVANSLTVTYNNGIEDVDVTLTAGTAAGTWTFTMPAFAVTVDAEFEDIPVLYAINISPFDAGAVTSLPANEASAAATVTLTVTPETGKQLVANSLTVTYNNGTDDVNVTLTAGTAAGTWTFTMPAFAVTVDAEFEDIPVLYAINIGTFTDGSVTSAPATEATAATTVTLTVTPETGKQLVANSLTVRYNNGIEDVDVTLTAGTAAGTWTFTMPAFAVTVDAEFEDIPVLYAINIGTLTGGAVTSAPATEATAAATVTLTVTPETGKQLVANSLTVTYNNGTDDVNVTLTAGTAAGTWTFTMPAFAVTVVAEFEDIPVLYELTVVNGTKAPNKQGYEAGESVTITATVPTGQQFVGWESSDIVTTGFTNPHTFNMPANNVTVTAVFENIPVESVEITGDNSIVSQARTLQLGVTVLPTEAANKNVTWSITVGGALASVSQSGFITVNANVNTGSITVRATANDGSGEYDEHVISINIPVLYELTVVNGTKAPNKLEYEAGESVTITATVLAGQQFVGWESGDIVTTGFTNPHTFNMPANNVTVTAVFENIPVTVTEISIATQPDKLEYFEGESLILAGLSVIITYSNGESEIVTFADFDAKGLTASPANGAPLTFDVHHDKPVVVRHTASTLTAETDILAINTQLPQYIVTINTNPTNGGVYEISDNFGIIAISNDNCYPLDFGQEYHLKAIANTGWMFAGWEYFNENTLDWDLITDAEYTFTVTGNMNFEAIFEPDPDYVAPQYLATININPTNGGTYEISDDLGDFTNLIDNCYPLNFEQEYYLSAKADDGWEFDRWHIEIKSDGVVIEESYEYINDIIFELPHFYYDDNVVDVIITAHFVEESSEFYYVEVDFWPLDGGAVTGGGEFQYGEIATITATANPGWIFAGWEYFNENTSDWDLITDAEYTFIVTGNMNFEAYFVKMAVYASAQGGTLIVNDVNVPYYEQSHELGDELTIEAVANPGFIFSHWEIDRFIDNEWSYDYWYEEEYTFTFDVPIELYAIFDVDPDYEFPPYTVTVATSPTGGGTFQIDAENGALIGNGAGGSFELEYGQYYCFVATANSGWIFEKWTIEEVYHGEEDVWNVYQDIKWYGLSIFDYGVVTDIKLTAHFIYTGTPDIPDPTDPVDPPNMISNVETPAETTPLRAWIRDGQLHITGLVVGETLSVYSITGALVYQTVATDEETNVYMHLSSGLYIVQSGNRTVRVSYER